MFDIVNHVINITASFYCFYDFVCQIPSDLFNHVVRPNCLLVTMTKCHFAGLVCKYGMSTIFTTTLHVIRLYIPTRALCSYGFVSHAHLVKTEDDASDNSSSCRANDRIHHEEQIEIVLIVVTT